jgi:hypothetical protein
LKKRKKGEKKFLCLHHPSSMCVDGPMWVLVHFGQEIKVGSLDIIEHIINDLGVE